MIGISSRIMERPLIRWSLYFAVIYVLLLGFDFSNIAQILGYSLNAEIARGIIAAAVLLNFRLISKLAKEMQVLVTWGQLFVLFLFFFYSFDLSYEFIWSRLPYLLGLGLKSGFLMGAALTVFICVVAIFASTILALIAALARLSKNGIALGISTFYISFFRGTPLLLQILLVYLGLPQVGLIIDPIPSAIIALSLCYGAYMAEIFRSGIQAISTGQSEAARALGLKSGQIMRLVILPQAIRLIIPPTGNQFIAMLKDSSLVSVLGAWELMYMARTHGRSEFKYMEMLISAAIIYWFLSVGFEIIQARIEKKYGKDIDVSH